MVSFHIWDNVLCRVHSLFWVCRRIYFLECLWTCYKSTPHSGFCCYFCVCILLSSLKVCMIVYSHLSTLGLKQSILLLFQLQQFRHKKKVVNNTVLLMYMLTLRYEWHEAWYLELQCYLTILSSTLSPKVVKAFFLWPWEKGVRVTHQNHFEKEMVLLFSPYSFIVDISYLTKH